MTDIISAFFNTSVVYHVRVTDPDVTLEKTYSLFQDAFPMIIVSQEGGTEDVPLHQHILLSKTIKPDKTKDIKDPLLTAYPNAKGNKGHSITIARNKKSLASYVLKDGSYKSKGFSKQWIAKAIELSYNQTKWKKKYKDLLESVILKEITIQSYTKSLLTLKAEANQPIYLNHLTAHVTSVAIRVGEIDASALADRVLEKVFS